MGASVVELGLITASYSSLSLIAAVPMGRAVDRWGERPFVVAGSAMLCIAPVGLALAASIPTLVVASAVLGLGHLCVSVGLQTLIARGAIAVRRERRFAAYTLANSVSLFVAPAACGLLVGNVVVTAGAGEVANGGRVYALVLVVGLLSLAASLSLLWRPGRLADRPAAVLDRDKSSLREVMRIPSVPVALLAGLSALATIDLLFAYLPAYGASEGISTKTIGLLLGAHGLASMLSRLAMPQLLKRTSRRQLLTVCLAIPAAALAVVPLSGSVPLLFVLMIVSGLGLGLCQPVTLEWVAGKVSRQARGTAMSVRLAGNRLGQMVVPLVVGALAGSTGLAAAFVGPAALLMTSGILVQRTQNADGE